MGHSFNLYVSALRHSRNALAVATSELIVMERHALTRLEFRDYDDEGVPHAYDLVVESDDEALFARTMRMRKIEIDRPRRHGMLNAVVTWIMRKHKLSDELREQVATSIWWLRLTQRDLLDLYEIYAASSTTQTKIVKDLVAGGMFMTAEAKADAVKSATECDARLRETICGLSAKKFRNDYFYIRRG